MVRNRFASLIVFTLLFAFATVTVLAASKTTTIKIEGMDCAGCSSSITKALKATSGVEEVDVSLEKNEAWIKFDDQKVTEIQLREVIKSTGFKVVEPTAQK